MSESVPSASDPPASSGEGMESAEPTRISVWDGIPLYVTKWMPSHGIRAIMYCAHGVGEHMGRYEKLGQELAENGILTFGHDHVGHGKSGGDRVHVNVFATYVQDVIDHVKAMKESYPGVPCFLMGHSMGGLIATLTAIESEELFTGVIFSAASLEVDPSVAGPVTKFFAKMLGFLFPQFGIKSLDTRLISTIPEEVKMYENDPLIYHQAIKAHWATEYMQAIETGRPKIDAIKIPALVFHGTGDSIVPLTASELIFKNIRSTDKTFERFEDDFHEVLHDKGQEKARDLIRDWILSHII